MSAPATILIIDDSALVVGTLTDALTERGFTVTAASNGHAGLAQLQLSVPDIILMDIVMPVMDGWETCRQIRSLAALQAVPIIIMTHRNTPQDLLRAFEVGADQFLVKPIDVDELHREIDELLKKKLDGQGSK
jgi:DNA-binding response OmpR family regulator